jgi:hypothetical protein
VIQQRGKTVKERNRARGSLFALGLASPTEKKPMPEHQTDKTLDLVWGADDIARELNITRRRAFYLLENNLIPRTKIGGKWCADRKQLHDHFRAAVTDKTLPPDKLTPRPKRRAA